MSVLSDYYKFSTLWDYFCILFTNTRANKWYNLQTDFGAFLSSLVDLTNHKYLRYLIEILSFWYQNFSILFTLISHQYNKINQFIFIRSNKPTEIIKREYEIILTLFIWLCSKCWYVLFAYSIVILNFIFDFLSHLILLYRLEDFGIVGWINNSFHVKFPPGKFVLISK
jgi:hypothetical protein